MEKQYFGHERHGSTQTEYLEDEGYQLTSSVSVVQGWKRCGAFCSNCFHGCGKPKGHFGKHCCFACGMQW